MAAREPKRPGRAPTDMALTTPLARRLRVPFNIAAVILCFAFMAMLDGSREATILMAPAGLVVVAYAAALRREPTPEDHPHYALGPRQTAIGLGSLGLAGVGAGLSVALDASGLLILCLPAAFSLAAFARHCAKERDMPLSSANRWGAVFVFLGCAIAFTVVAIAPGVRAVATML